MAWNTTSKSSNDWGFQSRIKSGFGWLAGDEDITAGIVTDPESGLEVFMGLVGEGVRFGNQSKPSASTWSNQSES